jgi:hypothetical protein
MNHRAEFLLSAVAAILLTGLAHAQSAKLPETNRTVFKCTVEGKVTYSDEPCPGAQRIDVEPTRGLNKASGKELTGTDVRRERQREAFADAVHPLTGKNSSQLETQRRRMKLSVTAGAECAALDRSIATGEAQEKIAKGEALSSVQGKLLSFRTRYRAIGC